MAGDEAVSLLTLEGELALAETKRAEARTRLDASLAGAPREHAARVFAEWDRQARLVRGLIAAAEKCSPEIDVI